MTIAVIVPVYKQSALLFEAIASLGEADRDGCAIVVVDDGCPHMATMLGGIGLAALDAQIHYVRGRNAGLSGARNRGIDFALQRLPELEALFFLDADNLLSEWSLAAMRRVLADHPESDWFYPDTPMFGLARQLDYGGPFSILTAALVNICDAGSLVRRRVFEQGLRFAEDMRLGFEDWDFWLSAIERGFRGRHFPAAGFRYRKRPESMLAESTRDAALIRADLERRHPWMRDLKTLLALEHCECPRFAVYFRDQGAVRLTSSAEAAGEEMSWAAYVARFWAATQASNRYHAGGFLLVTTSAAWQLLHRLGLLSWVLNDLERRLVQSDLAAVSLADAGADRFVVAEPATGAQPQAVIAAIPVWLLREVLANGDSTWLESAAGADPLPRASGRSVALPDWAALARPAEGMLHLLVAAAAELRAAEAAQTRLLPGSGAAAGSPDLAKLHVKLRHRCGGGVLPPMLARAQPQIAFVLPLFEFAGVEKVTLFAARALKRLGYGVSLAILKSRNIEFAAEVWRVFDRIFLLDNPEFGSPSAPVYLGTALTRWSVTGRQADELNLFSAFDAVIGCHAADLMGLLGGLRRQGVVTATWLHVFDRSETGGPCGHPHLALAYEHALDLVIACSDTLAGEMYARGIPADKLVVVPNAPALEVAPDRVAAVDAARRARADQSLRVLFLGRLDPQKGLDRLSELAAALAELPDVALRVVGKSVIAPGSEAELGVAVEPPVYDAEALTAAYAWADVLVLPSRYEGLPLSILEAMRLGVVPIATRVGAVAEAVRDGIDGFLVNQANCVADMLAHIAELQADRAMRRRMSAAAVEAMANRTWEQAVQDLDAALRTRLAERAPARPHFAPAPTADPPPPEAAAVPVDAAPISRRAAAMQVPRARRARPR